MKKKIYIKILISSIVFIIIISSVALLFSKRNIIITFGMFAGSNWNVPYGNSYEIIDNAIKRFEESHPGVKIKYVNGILKDDYSEWLSGKLLKGSGPDVFMILSEDFNTLSSVGAMKSLNNILEKDKEFDSEKYYRVSYESGQYQGEQFALPYESVPTLMFVNKTLLEEEGVKMPENDWTWGEFYEICRKVTKDTNVDGLIDRFGFYDYNWQDAIYSNGVTLFNEDGTKSYFADKKFEAAIRFIKDLEELNKGYKVTSDDFDTGKVAFHPLLFSEYSTYKTYPWKIKKYSDFEWDCIKLPSGESGENISEVSTLLMGINSKTDKEKLALEFLKLLTYDEVTQRDIFKYSQGVSVLKSVTESVEIMNELANDAPNDGYINMTLLSEVMESAVASPRFRKYESVMAMSDTMIKQGMDGNNDNLSYLLSKLQREVNKFLKN